VRENWKRSEMEWIWIKEREIVRERVSEGI
jgi:hypothetical protein